jgi:hypothetical protein
VDEAPASACKLNGSAESVFSLYLPGQPRAAMTVSKGEVEVALVPSREPLLSLTSAAIKLRAEARLPGLRFHTTRPVPFQGVSVPLPRAGLRATAISQEGITLLHEPMFFRKNYPMEARVSCKDISLSAALFSTEGVVPPVDQGKRVELIPGRKIPLRAEENGPVVLELEPPVPPPAGKKKKTREFAMTDLLSPLDFKVVKTSGTSSLIVHESFASILFGWVPSADLRTPTPGSSGMAGLLGGLMGMGEGAARPQPRRPHRICEGEMPLILEQQDTRMTLGTLAAGACIEIQKSDPEVTHVALRNTGLRTLGGARLLVPSWAMASCHASSEETPQCTGPRSDEEIESAWGNLSGEGLGSGIGGLGAPGKLTSPPPKKVK